MSIDLFRFDTNDDELLTTAQVMRMSRFNKVSVPPWCSEWLADGERRQSLNLLIDKTKDAVEAGTFSKEMPPMRPLIVIDEDDKWRIGHYDDESMSNEKFSYGSKAFETYDEAVSAAKELYNIVGAPPEFMSFLDEGRMPFNIVATKERWDRSNNS